MIVIAIARRALLAARTLFARRTFGALLAFAATLASFTAAFAFFAFVAAIAAAAATPPASAVAFAAFALLELALLLALVEFGFGLIAFAAFAFIGAFGLSAHFLVTFSIIVAEAVIELLGGRRRWLHRAHQTEIMVGVLQVVFAQHAITGACRIARQLQIALKDVSGRPADFRVRTVALHRAVWLMMMAAVVVMSTTTTAWLTAAAPLTLH